jgi:formiminotetrahydrofolate cyclodeaminase
MIGARIAGQARVPWQLIGWPTQGGGRVPISDEKIGDFLERLAARVPAPGGGAAAALQVAQGAALLGMVARYTTGGQYAEHEEVVGRIIAEADELRALALRLADADADAFTGVHQAYRLPSSSEEETAARSAAIARALAHAAWPPAQVISVAGMVVDLAEALAAIGDRNVLSDLAAAAEAARAAVATARVNVEINLASITDEQAGLEMIAEEGKADAIIARAEQVTAAVREQIRA